MRTAFPVAISLALLSATPALATTHHHHRHYAAARHHHVAVAKADTGFNFFSIFDVAARPAYPIEDAAIQRHAGRHRDTPSSIAYDAIVEPVRHFASDPRPGAWCGWEMRQELGVADRAYNLARNWAHWGSNAGGPHVGVVVVWAHHVGRIVGQQNGEWIVHSGNYRNRIADVPMRLNGVIAFRE